MGIRGLSGDGSRSTISSSGGDSHGERHKCNESGGGLCVEAMQLKWGCPFSPCVFVGLAFTTCLIYSFGPTLSEQLFVPTYWLSRISVSSGIRCLWSRFYQ